MAPTASLTLNTTTAFLAGVCLVQTVQALRSPRPSSTRANYIGACVCLVAFLHYRWMRDADANEKIRLRYGDWIVTCPLLLWELQELTGVEEQQWALGAVVLMVVLGYAAVQSSGRRRAALFIVSSGLLAAVTLATTLGARRHKEAVAGFFALWALYPVAFLLDSNAMYDVLDLASKGLFGLFVASADDLVR